MAMTNQLPAGTWLRFPRFGELWGRGYGLAGGVIVEPSAIDHEDSTGELYWGGVAGTHWWISPNASLAGLLMTQRQMAFAHPYIFEFKQLVYQAVSQAS